MFFSTGAAAWSSAGRPPVDLKANQLLLVRGAYIAAIASSGPYLVWETGSSKRHPLSALMERDQRTGRMRRLARSTLPAFGIGTTAQWVVYATEAASRIDLVAVRHDGSKRFALTHSLAAPVTSRGDRIAWAEQDDDVQRVVVREMAAGRQWTAWQLGRCRHNRCYRIDAVTLADEGVAFDRGAIGMQPSIVVRRRFDQPRPSLFEVAHDPQPDLATSSAGVLFYWLGHGWMRWDFARKRPEPTNVKGSSWVLADEHDRLLLRGGSRCNPRLIVQLPRERSFVIRAPASTSASPKGFGPLCRLLTGVTWQGSRLLAAWYVIPKLSLQAHADVGLVGVIMATHIP
jgi:hypothetical protein